MEKEVIKLGSSGSIVKYLQGILRSLGYSEILVDGDFAPRTDAAIRNYQLKNGLKDDGVVGPITWVSLEKNNISLSDSDWQRCSNLLGISVPALRAVQEVESGGRGGFLEKGKPVILFEGHVFWDRLKKHGENPESYVRGNEDILYKNWTKSHYLGGSKEYYRLERAEKINHIAALESASYGMFQIMGFNYAACDCVDVEEYVFEMSQSEGRQLDLFAIFLKSNGWDKYLRALDWAGFARKYNGPGYKENQYDVKLERAYKKFLGMS